MRPERNGWTPGSASSAPPDRMIRAGQAAVARLSLAVVTSPPAPDRRTVLTQSAAETFPADAPPPGTYALDPERATVRAAEPCCGPSVLARLRPGRAAGAVPARAPVPRRSISGP